MYSKSRCAFHISGLVHYSARVAVTEFSVVVLVTRGVVVGKVRTHAEITVDQILNIKKYSGL